MTIAVGDRIPAATLKHVADGVQPIETESLFAGKRVALFSVPGAFTPTCSERHLPGFVEHFEAIKAKGIDTIACMSVNDAFVMQAWGRDQSVPEDLLMLADGNAEFSKALGLEMDATRYGMGVRSKRFALIANDGVVEHLAVEAPGEFNVSSAEAILAAL
ncbi:MAG: peroxiredoxin [Lysobacterales bacterium]